MAKDLFGECYVTLLPSLENLQDVGHPIMALENDALRRCSWLDIHAKKISESNGSHDLTKTSSHEAKTLSILDEVRTMTSDEGTMAVFRHISPVFLQIAGGLIHPTERNAVTSLSSRDPRHADFKLARQGELRSATYGRLKNREESDPWVRQLILAGSERSVSPSQCLSSARN